MGRPSSRLMQLHQVAHRSNVQPSPIQFESLEGQPSSPENWGKPIVWQARLTQIKLRARDTEQTGPRFFYRKNAMNSGMEPVSLARGYLEVPR